MEEKRAVENRVTPYLIHCHRRGRRGGKGWHDDNGLNGLLSLSDDAFHLFRLFCFDTSLVPFTPNQLAISHFGRIFRFSVFPACRGTCHLRDGLSVIMIIWQAFRNSCHGCINLFLHNFPVPTPEAMHSTESTHRLLLVSWDQCCYPTRAVFSSQITRDLVKYSQCWIWHFAHFSQAPTRQPRSLYILCANLYNNYPQILFFSHTLSFSFLFLLPSHLCLPQRSGFFLVIPIPPQSHSPHNGRLQVSHSTSGGRHSRFFRSRWHEIGCARRHGWNS